MSRVSPRAWATLRAACATALYAMLLTLAVFWYARSMTPEQPRRLATVTLGRTGRPTLPLDGLMHVLQAPTHGGAPVPVLLNQEPWKRSRAADAVVRATTLHRLLAQRYADMTPAAKDAAGGPVLEGLPDTTRTLRWAQHPADLSGVDGGHTPVVETVRDLDDTYYFAFVRCEAPLAPQVLTVLSHMFDAPLQRAQLKALAEK